MVVSLLRQNGFLSGLGTTTEPLIGVISEYVPAVSTVGGYTHMCPLFNLFCVRVFGCDFEISIDRADVRRRVCFVFVFVSFFGLVLDIGHWRYKLRSAAGHQIQNPNQQT